MDLYDDVDEDDYLRKESRVVRLPGKTTGYLHTSVAKEADRSKQGNLHFSHIITCSPKVARLTPKHSSN